MKTIKLSFYSWFPNRQLKIHLNQHLHKIFYPVFTFNFLLLLITKLHTLGCQSLYFFCFVYSVYLYEQQTFEFQFDQCNEVSKCVAKFIQFLLDSVLTFVSNCIPSTKPVRFLPLNKVHGHWQWFIPRSGKLIYTHRSKEKYCICLSSLACNIHFLMQIYYSWWYLTFTSAQRKCIFYYIRKHTHTQKTLAK